MSETIVFAELDSQVLKISHVQKSLGLFLGVGLRHFERFMVVLMRVHTRSLSTESKDFGEMAFCCPKRFGPARTCHIVLAWVSSGHEASDQRKCSQLDVVT